VWENPSTERQRPIRKVILPVLNSIGSILLAAACLLPRILLGAEPVEADPVQEELRALREGLIAAYNANDIDQLLSYCHDGVIVTWQNGEVSVGPQEIRSYYQRMMEGPDRVVDRLTADPKPDGPSVVYGGTTAVSRGKMNDHYQLTGGMEFDLNSRWSATAINEDGRWRIASFHASVNAFDNELLRMAVQRTMLWSGGIALVLGLALGALGSRWLWKPKRNEELP
jgi:ketosteroid isomerase-like protein